MSYLKRLRKDRVPQWEPLPGQIENSNGGYSWPVDEWTRLRRFLILGSEGGSYYASEWTLTRENADAVERAVRADGVPRDRQRAFSDQPTRKSAGHHRRGERHDGMDFSFSRSLGGYDQRRGPSARRP